MLNEGHRRQARGSGVVVGFVESHGRQLTEKLVEGLEVVPRQVVDYRGSRLEEMDLDAVLRRHPKIALIDELAHTNVAGSGRRTRWQQLSSGGSNVMRIIREAARSASTFMSSPGASCPPRRRPRPQRRPRPSPVTEVRARSGR